MSKQKFYFKIQPQGLSVKCSSSFLADADKLPPLYLSVQKGSHSACTSSVQLTASKYKPGCFSASWKSHDVENIVEMTLPVTRRSSGKGYEPKEVKVAVKFEDAATGKQQNLASCKFDVTTLNLAKKKSERKVVELIPSKTANDAFKSVSVVMTITHELADASAAALDSGSERSGSVSPPNYLTESFVQGIKKAGAVKTKAKSSSGTENGQIHHLPTTKQEQPTSKQERLMTNKQEQSTSKQELSTSKQEQSTSKQEQSKSKQEQSTNKQEQSISKQELSISKQEQSTNKQEQSPSEQELPTRQESATKQDKDTEEESNERQHQPTDRQQQLQQKTTKGQQKHDSFADHSKQSSNIISNTVPCTSSVVEPMEHNHVNATIDAWQSEQPHQKEIDDKLKITETNTRVSENKRFDNGTSPISSDSVTSPDPVHYKESVSDDDLAALQNDEDRLGQLENRTPLSSYSHDLSRLTPRKRAISVDVLTTTTETSKTPVYFHLEEPTPSRYGSQTVLGEPKRKAPPIPTNKSSVTQSKRPVSTYSSLSDLQKPVQSSINSANKSPSTQNKRPVSVYSSLSDLRRPVLGSVTSASSLTTSSVGYYGKFDILGVLRVRLRGVSIPDHTTEITEAPPPRVNPLYQIKPRSISAGAVAVPEATHGIYCVFTINGGNTSAKSETCKVLPYRPVLWGEGEKEKLFFTNHSKQLFILCRKVPLKKKSKGKGSSEVCVGASVMKIIEVTPTLLEQETVDFTSSNGLKWFNKTLPLQPKGEIELSVSFNGLTPRYKVTCNGIITVMKVNGIDCQPDVDLSCTIKLDSDMLDSTNVYTVDECAVDGWYDEPIKFKAKKSLDLVVQIWAYSDDGSANWCGLSMLPLATMLHPQDVRKTWAMTPTGGKDREVFVYHKNERTITCPVEPQGTIELKVEVSPDEKIKSQDFVPFEISGNHTPAPVVINTTTTTTTTTTNTTLPPPATAPTPTVAAAAAATATAIDTVTNIATNTAVTTNAIASNNATTTTATATAAASSKEKSTTATPTKATAETITTATTTAIKAATSTTASTASDNEKQEDNQAQKGLSEADSDGAEPTLKRQGTLRRKYNIHRGKQNDKPPEPQARSVDELKQENIDLKREVEYLREQLRMIKAKFADSEFHKEKAEAELRTISKHKEEKKRTRIFSFGRK